MPWLVSILVALVWAVLVLYPDPRLLARSLENVRRPPVDAAAVAGLAQRLPDDPRTIERIVLERIVPYAYDWHVNGVPWYFPTTAEAVRARRGDCESRALVLASILEAKSIPHELRMSFDHIWVDYPGKADNPWENDSVAIADQGKDGFAFHWPKDFHPWQELQDQLAIFWAPMPPERKLLLFAGVLLALGWNAWLLTVARLVGGDVIAPPPARLASRGRGRRWPRLLRRRPPVWTAIVGALTRLR
jgi:hypothetical protein